MTVTSWRARVTWSEAEPLVLQPGRIRASTDGAFDCCAAEQFVPAGADLLARKLASMLPLSIAALRKWTMQCCLPIMLLLLSSTVKSRRDSKRQTVIGRDA